ncbi:GBS Bsp-like repeat-containing protein [Streptococcus sp. E17BB]|uniref:GBS Bsp-like repeat-containing protein n=1 Tax=Streptococcus sp. E17BB TaxID=3278714 RepID=UPI00359D907E
MSEESLPASGTYTFTERVGVKSEPKMSAPDRDYYTAGEKANYDKTVENDNHLWISYVSYSGSRSYVPVKDLGPSTSSTPTETVKPVAEKAPAKVEVVGYDEYKTNFTIKGTGTPDTKQIAHVRAAVWSADKGQDDLKWYEPKVVNNQVSATVDIANHSNTSDKYTVHVYTTYTDNQTVGTNLGAFEVIKPEPKLATIEVQDYQENKTYFTVKVTGYENSKEVKDVRVAVWSKDKGQDDVKWYTPEVTNNRAAATISIANHSNTSDQYTVHVYTTYSDGSTIGTDAGTFNIKKPNLATIYGTDQVNSVSDSIKKVLQIAGDLLGVEIGGAAHKKIVDDYNAVSPLPVGYKVAYDDDWCDVFTTVVFQRAGLSHLIGRECGVERHTKIFKSLGIWNEDGSTTPKTGDIITFNWDQNYQANDGFADHIGIVTHVQDGIIHTIERNNDQQVRRRTYKIGHGNIRGFARPNYS